MNFILLVPKLCFYHSSLATVCFYLFFIVKILGINGFIQRKQSLGAKIFHMLMIILSVSPGAPDSLQSFILSPTTQIPQQGGSLWSTITEVPPVQRFPPTQELPGWWMTQLMDLRQNSSLNLSIIENLQRDIGVKENIGSLQIILSVWICLWIDTFQEIGSVKNRHGCFVSTCPF